MGHCDLRPNKALNQDLYDGAKEMCARPIAIFYGLLYDSRRTRATACGCCRTGGRGVAFWATWTKTENEQPLPRGVTIFRRAVKEIAEFYRPGRQDQMVGGYETSSSSKNRLFEWKFDRIRLVKAVSSSSQWNMDFRLFRTIGLDFLSTGRESFLEPPPYILWLIHCHLTATPTERPFFFFNQFERNFIWHWPTVTLVFHF